MNLLRLVVWLCLALALVVPAQAAQLSKMDLLKARPENRPCSYPINHTDPSGLEPADQVYKDMYNKYSRGLSTVPNSGNAYLSSNGGLPMLKSMMLEAARRVDSNSDFLDVIQSLLLPDSAVKWWAKASGLLEQSKYQGANQAIAPGMNGWDSSWTDGVDPSQDQSHHLIAYVVASYRTSSSKGSLASVALDGPQNNIADVHLGYLGAQYGDLLAFKATGNEEKDRKYRFHWVNALTNRLSWPDPFND